MKTKRYKQFRQMSFLESKQSIAVPTLSRNLNFIFIRSKPYPMFCLADNHQDNGPLQVSLRLFIVKPNERQTLQHRTTEQTGTNIWK